MPHSLGSISLKPDIAEAHFYLGVAYLDKGYIDDSINEFKEAIRLKPDNVDAHLNLGIVYSEKGNIDDAIKEYKEAIRLKPDLEVSYHLSNKKNSRRLLS